MNIEEKSNKYIGYCVKQVSGFGIILFFCYNYLMTVTELLMKTKNAIGRVEAEQLLCTVLRKDRSFFFAHGGDDLEAALQAEFAAEDGAKPKGCADCSELLATIDSMVAERLRGRPLQYVLGTAEFMGMEFAVNEAVLIPRPETELLCEEAARILRKAQAKYGAAGAVNDTARSGAQMSVLDICTGSGCIAVYLASRFPRADVTASDISADALSVAAENAHRLLDCNSVRFVQSDLFEAIAGRFDLITANPPYIPSEAVLTLQKEVAEYEPHLALDGGREGWELPVSLIRDAAGHLKPQGVLLMEIGDDQGSIVSAEARLSGFTDCKIIKDYSGQDRFLKARK